MKLPELFPPADLLERVEGVKRGLRQRRRLGRLGWTGVLLASTIQIMMLVASSPFGKALQDLATSVHESEWSTVVKLAGYWWPYLVPAFAIVFFLVVANWARFWLEESKAPFRYTCSVADFTPVASGVTAPESNWSWLAHDLKERLNQRIGRLQFIDAALVAPSADFQSHVHLSGAYGVRKDRQDRWVVEVTPSVRIGPPGNPETLAHGVVVPLAPDADGAPTALAALSAPIYDRIIERLYFSVSSELYKQIQRDVTERIELLPTNYFRAVALFYEAEDYARSNTLDAYDEALQLYRRAMELLDPSLRPLPQFAAYRAVRRLMRVISRSWTRIRCVAAFAYPRFGDVQVMCARAEIGYATMILYRRELAGQSGQLLNTSYEARPVAERALARLTRLPKDVPRWQTAIFDAHVVLALASCYIGATRRCEQHLAEASRLDPRRTIGDARYLYTTGLAEHQLATRAQTFRRVVELAPRFESAQFALARSVETLWRTRPVLERNVAEIIFAEYDEVSKINPGNLGAWADRGYVSWLLGEEEDLVRAQEAFESGREAKAVKQVTFVAELDYGQARIAAERGNFQAAYEHYLASVPAILALGHTSGAFEDYYFERISEPMFQRFSRYREHVEAQWEVWEPFDDPARCFAEWVGKLRVELDDAACLAAGQLSSLMSVIDQRLDAADRAKLWQVIERHAQARTTRMHLSDGLPALARIFTDSQKGASVAVRTAALASLSDPDLTCVVRRVMDMAATSRVRNVVLAFALNDYGQACSRHFNATGDERSQKAASDAFWRCIDELNPDYVMPYYNLYRLHVFDDDPDWLLDRMVELAPEWPEGSLAYAEYDAGLAVEHATNATARRAEAEKAKAEAHAEAARRLALPQDRAGGVHQLADIGGAEDQVEKLFEEARRLLRSADEQVYQSELLTEAVVRRLAGLAPHGWLWESQGQGRVQFRWSTLGDRDLDKELTWERECTDLHVRALLTLTMLPAAGGSQSNAWRLLQHLRHHFWPDDFRINRRLRDLLVADVRIAVGGAAFTEVFSDTAHRKLIADEETRKLLQEGALLRLAWQHPTARSLLLRPSFRRVWRRPEYCALLDIPEILSLPHTETQSHLSRIATENVVRLLRGSGYNKLLREQGYQAIPGDRRRILRPNSGLRSHKFQRLFDYAEADRTIRWVIERWLEDNQYPYWALTWLSDPAFAIDEDPVLGQSAQRERGRRAILEGASQLEGRVPAFYFRVGQQLEMLPDGSSEAVDAYLKACASDDAKTLHALGERLKAHGRLNESVTAFRRGLEKDPDRKVYPEWKHRSAAATVMWIQGSRREAIHELRQITTEPRWWRTPVIQALSGVMQSKEDANLLRDWLELVRPQRRETPGEERVELADYHRAVLALAKSRHGEPWTSQMIPVTTPLALEIQLALFPQEEGWEADHPLFKKYIPEMRARIFSETGVRFPGIRVRGSEDAPAGSYTILVDEVPEATGIVVAGGFFFTSIETPGRSSTGEPPLLIGVDPMTGRPGEWIAVANLGGEVHANGNIWDPMQYIVRHVEALLRPRLGAFVGVQELANMLETWRGETDSTNPSRGDLIKSKLRDTVARLQLLEVVGRLLRDRVPITDLRTILDVFEAQPSGEVSDAHLTRITEAIRLRLREVLPGNKVDSHFFYLSPQLEAEIGDYVARTDGRMHPALPVAAKTALFDAIRSTFVGQPKFGQVIVTRRDGIRPFVNRLVETKFPRTTVLAYKELLPSLRQKVSGTIECTPRVNRV